MLIVDALSLLRWHWRTLNEKTAKYLVVMSQRHHESPADERSGRRLQDRDDLIRVVGGIVATAIGLAGVVIYPRSYYLWLPFALFVALGVLILALALVRLARRSRHGPDA